MKLINKLDRYLFENEFKIILKNNCLDICNYDEIIDFSLTKISIKCSNNIITIDGYNLVISQMLDSEVLIKGNITNISIK